MGTNYYVVGKTCECCGNPISEEKHIGKSSAGWCFSLRVYPDEGINTLDDWKTYLDGKTISNEYGEEISLEKLLSIITGRSHPKGLNRHTWGGSEPGEGTWDYVDYEFS